MLAKVTRLNIIIIIREATMVNKELIGNNKLLKAISTHNIKDIRIVVSFQHNPTPALQIQVSLILRFSLLNRIYYLKMKMKRTCPRPR